MQLLSRLKNRRLGLKLTSWQCSRLLSTGKAPSEAFAVIIGGGVAGTSVAYHLAKRGLREIVLLERGTLASSTTFHSPGLVSSSHPCHRYKPILAYSVELYSQLEQETGA
uniref:FAD dependent oxidoreductase domain-containing protein n=1 Tax=Plectus sambesii TaxID=2011161 RepID=A0A914X170_9BILA